MKRLLAMLLVALMIAAFSACSVSDTEKVDDKAEENIEETVENTEEDAEPVAPIDVLNTVFENYSEEEKSYFMAPTEVEISDKDTLANMLVCKETASSYISAAVYYAHFMNLNNLTVSAYTIADMANMDAFVEAIKADVNGNQWMCGFPEKLVIATVGDCAVVAFGSADNVDTMAGNLADAYTVETVVDQPLA